MKFNEIQIGWGGNRELKLNKLKFKCCLFLHIDFKLKKCCWMIFFENFSHLINIDIWLSR